MDPNFSTDQQMQKIGAKTRQSRAIDAIEQENLNLRFNGVQAKVDEKVNKRQEQVATKTKRKRNK